MLGGEFGPPVEVRGIEVGLRGAERRAEQAQVAGGVERGNGDRDRLSRQLPHVWDQRRGPVAGARVLRPKLVLQLHERDPLVIGVPGEQRRRPAARAGDVPVVVPPVEERQFYNSPWEAARPTTRSSRALIAGFGSG